MTIRDLFDPSRDISRTIEKVITYGVAQEQRLKAEISEYVVTESIEEQFARLLDRMQLAMEAGGENEIGVWVSGFYGSGKSSFTKYLGLAFDDRIVIDGVPFLRHLQDRLHKPQTRALLATVAQRFPAAVVMLDLASEMLAGATMEDVSTVLYYKVLQWAGYSRNLKVAAFERQVEKDGRRDELIRRLGEEFPGATWEQVQNNPLAIDALIPQLAHGMYPGLFPTPEAFSSRTDDFIQFEDKRVEEMIGIVRERSGKRNIVFIVDEVGQYVASRDNLILNLDGLAKNLKRLGDGKVWIISTAQQTLTEDDPRAALNSEKLYKLKDRFPIQIDLESSDIKEICYRRLLGKSPAGASELQRLFDAYGQALRHNTRLQDARFYDADFNRDDFVNLYPFLPAHFDILLHLLGALAKSTGGIGLRSAIKIVQDVLRGEGGSHAMADQPVGWLATTVTLYDELAKDIARGFPSIHQAVGKVAIRFPDSHIQQEVAKSVAVLQILGNLPVTVQNVASLMHPSVTAASIRDDVQKVVDDMLKDVFVPLGEKDGALVFLSEKLRDLEQERANLLPRSIDLRRVLNDALRETFYPLPRVMLAGNFAVTSGLKVQHGGTTSSLAGDQNTIQTVVEFVDASDYDAARTHMVDESRSRSGRNTIGLVARASADAGDFATEIFRSQRITEVHKNDTDQEIREYCNGQIERANRIAVQLQSKLKQALQGGSFVFRGQQSAVTTYSAELGEAAKKILAEAADQVFDRYAEAPHRVATDIAEKFLKAATPAAIGTAMDPLGLVQTVGGQTKFKMDHKAVVSIRDFIEKRDSVEGKRLLDEFSSDPFGWSPDTTRYILAAMLTAGELKLKVSGREVTTPGPQAVEALKTNNSFRAIGVSLRHERPDNNTLARASERLTQVAGEMVLPLEQDIAKAAVKHLPRLQNAYGTLPERLRGLGLAGVDRLTSMGDEITAILSTDGSDAPQRFGAEISSVYDDLIWAGEVKKALDNGLDQIIRELDTHRREIMGLPSTGIPGALKDALREDLDAFGERLGQADFHSHSADFASLLTEVKGQVRDACASLARLQKERIAGAVEELRSLPGWAIMTAEERQNAASRLESLAIGAPSILSGLKELLARDFDLGSTLADLKRSVQETGRKRLEDQEQNGEANAAGGFGENPSEVFTKGLKLPRKITSISDLDVLIARLSQLRSEASRFREIDLALEPEQER